MRGRGGSCSRRGEEGVGGIAGATFEMAAAEVSADSDELARAFRDDVAHRSDTMPLGVGASLAVEILHPALFPMRPGAGTVAAARAAEADEAASKAEQARLAAVTASREAARAMMRVAENLKESA